MGSESSRPAPDYGNAAYKEVEQGPPASAPVSRRLDSEISDSQMEFEFDGASSKSEWFAGMVNVFFRTDSVDVNNDPRIMSDSVIAHRLSAFSNVVIAAMLLCTLAFSAVLVLAPSAAKQTTKRESWINLAALIGMLLTMCMNLFCTVVVIQQNYLVNRIGTSGAMGFEMSKSLYLNRTFVTLRHVAISCFYRSIPLFIVSTALFVWQQVSPQGDAVLSGCIITTLMVLLTLLLFYVHRKHKVIFHEKLNKMQVYESPMRKHMEKDLSGPHLRHGGSMS